MATEIVQFSEQGNSPKAMNQDALLVRDNPYAGLFMIADGMGGTRDGDRASRTLVAMLDHWWEKRQGAFSTLPFDSAVDELKQVILTTNHEIWATTQEGSVTGSTVVLLFIMGRQYVVIWAGDSRCYRYERRFFSMKELQISVDDVWQNEERVTKDMTEEEIRHHKEYGHLTRAIGIKDKIALNERREELKGRVLFTLESDGIYKYISEEQRKSLCMYALKSGDLSGAAETVKQAVYAAGAKDNLSLIMVRTDGYSLA